MGLLGIETGIPGGVSGTMSPWVFWPLLIIVAGIGWALLIVYRPLTLCKHCDNGKDWDSAREHFGLRCDGWGRLWLRIGTCHGAGRKLRWEIRVLRLVGIGRRIPDPVAKARGR